MVLREMMRVHVYVVLILPVGGSTSNTLSVVRCHINDKCVFRSALSNLYFVFSLLDVRTGL
jgi:alcohol dehydrogenase YqhD (iron-dependent ADH family)